MDNYRAEPLPEQQPARKPIRSGCLGFAIDTIETVLLAVILFLAINAVTDRVRVENISMQPTLYSGELVLVNKLAYKIGQPSYGDIIVFPYPVDPRERFIKRVIGLPGDVVRIQGNNVFVNDHLLSEPYIAAEPSYNGTWTVPEDSIFVLGDNRNQSSDSHIWGFVQINKVIGKALAIYWPLENMKILEHPNIVKASP